MVGLTRKPVGKQGRKAGGSNCPRAYDFAILTSDSGKVVTFSCKSSKEAEKKGKRYCKLFGYNYSHTVKGQLS